MFTITQKLYLSIPLDFGSEVLDKVTIVPALNSMTLSRFAVTVYNSLTLLHSHLNTV